jgi:hypothetical protein
MPQVTCTVTDELTFDLTAQTVPADPSVGISSSSVEDIDIEGIRYEQLKYTFDGLFLAKSVIKTDLMEGVDPSCPGFRRFIQNILAARADSWEDQF